MTGDSHRSLRHKPGRDRKQRSAYSSWWHSRWRWLRHKIRAGVALTALLIGTSSLLGCGQVLGLDQDEWQSVCTAVLWCDAPEKPAELIDVLLHSFAGSPATPEAARTVIRQILSRAIDHPGSLIRWWVTGTDTVLETALKSPSFVGRSRRARKLEREHWLLSTEATLLSALTPRLTTPHQLPNSLAEAIATIARSATASTLRHQLVVVSDGREVLLKRAGCELLAMDTIVLEQLPWRRVLTPGLLRNTHAHLTFFNPPPLPGMPNAPLIRRSLWDSLWGEVLWQAGASEVFIERGDKGVHFLDDPSPFRDRYPFWLLPSAAKDQEQPVK